MDTEIGTKPPHIAALSYLERGWSILPVGGDKKPLLNWKPYQDRAATAEEVDSWFARWPDLHLALVTGRISRVVALDVDVKNGHRGDATLAELEGQHGTLPRTVSQQTTSGGTHYLFAYPVGGAGNSAGKLGDGIDIRGDGGYVVVAPSPGYAWVVGHDPEDVPLAEMPEWLLERVNSAEAAEGTERPRNAPGWADDLLDGVAEGSRDNDCIRLIGRYCAMRPPLSKGEVLAFMLTWAGRCRPAFPDVLVHEKVERFFTAMETDLLDYPLTDAGNAERMVSLFGDQFRWVTDREEWLAWDGRRWAPGRTDAVKVYALRTARAIQAAAVRMDDATRPQGRPEKEDLVLHGLRLESAKGIHNTVQVARVIEATWVGASQLDPHPDLLNVANGTLDLRTFELRRHDAGNMLTRLIDVPYDPAAQAPRWLKFLDDVFCGRQEVIDYVQRAVGYTLTGSIDEQCFFLLHGGGANGKSTFVSVLTALFNDYAAKLDAEAVLSADRNRGRGATPELVVLVGRRLAYVDELEEGRQLDEARIKALTGSERATGRALYQNMQEWTNTAKLWMDLNHLPTFKGIDFGIERRPRVIPFDRRFEDSEQDKQMAGKLLTELPGILAWAVEGCKQWRARGLDAPEAVSLATRRYRDENNHLPSFAEEQYVKRAGAQVSVATVKEDYSGWCASRDEVKLDYQRKVIPFLEQVWQLTRKRTKAGFVWLGIAQRQDVERIEAALASRAASGATGGEP